MFVNNNTVEQINVALNDIYTKINNLNINTADIESIKLILQYSENIK